MDKKENPKTTQEWVALILKIVIYAAGLLLAGYGTAEACRLL